MSDFLLNGRVNTGQITSDIVESVVRATKQITSKGINVPISVKTDSIKQAAGAFRKATSSINTLNKKLGALTRAINSSSKLGASPKRFATGGFVRGSGSRDNVRALLTPGEYVLTRSQVRAIGRDNLQRYAKGGKIVLQGGQAGILGLRSTRPDGVRSVRAGGPLLQSINKKLSGITGGTKISNVEGRAEFQTIRDDKIKNDLKKVTQRALRKATGSALKAIGGSREKALAKGRAELEGKLYDLFGGDSVHGNIFEAAVSAYVKGVGNLNKADNRAPFDLSGVQSKKFEKLASFKTKASRIEIKGGQYQDEEVLKKAINSVLTGSLNSPTGVRKGEVRALFGSTFPQIKYSTQGKSLAQVVGEFNQNAREFRKNNPADFTNAVLRASKGGTLTKAQRGIFERKGVRLNSGGFVPGLGNRDTVPALLTPGEFVINKRSANILGTPRLKQLNRAHMGGRVQKFARGGAVQRLAWGGGVQRLNTGNTVAGGSGGAGSLGSVSIQGGTKQVVQLNSSLENLNKNLQEGAGFFNVFGGSIVKSTVRMAAFGAGSRVLFGVTDSIRNAVAQIITMNQAMTNLNKIFQLSKGELESFKGELITVAKEFGVSIESITEATTIFVQQGLSVTETLEATKASILAVNAANLSFADATELITVAVNSFGLSFEDATSVIDKLTTIADSSAASVNDLTQILRRSGAAAATAGLSLDEFAAITATVRESTRLSSTTIGAGMKTILVGVQQNEKVLGEYGIQVRKSNGEMVSTMEIIRRISSRWQSLSKEQRVNLAATVAGKRRFTEFAAIMSNFGKAQDLVTLSANAAGNAQAKQAAQLETITTAINRVQASIAEVVNDLGKAGGEQLIKDLVSAGGSLVDVLGAVVKAASAIPGLLPIAAFGTFFKFVNPHLREVAAGAAEVGINFIKAGASMEIASDKIVGEAERQKNAIESIGRAQDQTVKSLTRGERAARKLAGGLGIAASAVTFFGASWAKSFSEIDEEAVKANSAVDNIAANTSGAGEALQTAAIGAQLFVAPLLMASAPLGLIAAGATAIYSIFKGISEASEHAARQRALIAKKDEESRNILRSLVSSHAELLDLSDKINKAKKEGNREDLKKIAIAQAEKNVAAAEAKKTRGGEVKLEALNLELETARLMKLFREAGDDISKVDFSNLEGAVSSVERLFLGFKGASVEAKILKEAFKKVNAILPRDTRTETPEYLKASNIKGRNRNVEMAKVQRYVDPIGDRVQAIKDSLGDLDRIESKAEIDKTIAAYAALSEELGNLGDKGKAYKTAVDEMKRDTEALGERLQELQEDRIKGVVERLAEMGKTFDITVTPEEIDVKAPEELAGKYQELKEFAERWGISEERLAGIIIRTQRAVRDSTLDAEKYGAALKESRLRADEFARSLDFIRQKQELLNKIDANEYAEKMRLASIVNNQELVKSLKIKQDSLTLSRNLVLQQRELQSIESARAQAQVRLELTKPVEGKDFKERSLALANIKLEPGDLNSYEKLREKADSVSSALFKVNTLLTEMKESGVDAGPLVNDINVVKDQLEKMSSAIERGSDNLRKMNDIDLQRLTSELDKVRAKIDKTAEAELFDLDRSRVRDELGALEKQLSRELTDKRSELDIKFRTKVDLAAAGDDPQARLRIENQAQRDLVDLKIKGVEAEKEAKIEAIKLEQKFLDDKIRIEKQAEIDKITTAVETANTNIKAAHEARQLMVQGSLAFAKVVDKLSLVTGAAGSPLVKSLEEELKALKSQGPPQLSPDTEQAKKLEESRDAAIAKNKILAEEKIRRLQIETEHKKKEIILLASDEFRNRIHDAGQELAKALGESSSSLVNAVVGATDSFLQAFGRATEEGEGTGEALTSGLIAALGSGGLGQAIGGLFKTGATLKQVDQTSSAVSEGVKEALRQDRAASPPSIDRIRAIEGEEAALAAEEAAWARANAVTAPGRGPFNLETVGSMAGIAGGLIGGIGAGMNLRGDKGIDAMNTTIDLVTDIGAAAANAVPGLGGIVKLFGGFLKLTGGVSAKLTSKRLRKQARRGQKFTTGFDVLGQDIAPIAKGVAGLAGVGFAAPSLAPSLAGVGGLGGGIAGGVLGAGTATLGALGPLGLLVGGVMAFSSNRARKKAKKKRRRARRQTRRNFVAAARDFETLEEQGRFGLRQQFGGVSFEEQLAFEKKKFDIIKQQKGAAEAFQKTVETTNKILADRLNELRQFGKSRFGAGAESIVQARLGKALAKQIAAEPNIGLGISFVPELTAALESGLQTLAITDPETKTAVEGVQASIGLFKSGVVDSVEAGTALQASLQEKMVQLFELTLANGRDQLSQFVDLRRHGIGVSPEFFKAITGFAADLSLSMGRGGTLAGQRIEDFGFLARGSLSRAEIGGLISAGIQEKRLMPSGSRLVVANDSETIMTRTQSRRILGRRRVGNAANGNIGGGVAFDDLNINLKIDNNKVVRLSGVNQLSREATKALEDKMGQTVDREEFEAVRRVLDDVIFQLKDRRILGAL